MDDDSDDDVPLKPAKKPKAEPAAEKKKGPAAKKGLASSMPLELAATASKSAILCQAVALALILGTF